MITRQNQAQSLPDADDGKGVTDGAEFVGGRGGTRRVAERHDKGHWVSFWGEEQILKLTLGIEERKLHQACARNYEGTPYHYLAGGRAARPPYIPTVTLTVNSSFNGPAHQTR